MNSLQVQNNMSQFFFVPCIGILNFLMHSQVTALYIDQQVYLQSK